MKFESAAIHAGEKVLAQPWNQNCQRAEAKNKKRNQEGAAVMQTELEQAVIPLPETFEGFLKSLLHPYQRITGGGATSIHVIAAQEIFGHRWDDRAGKKVRRQHGENHGFSERYKQVPRHAGQHEHRSKHNADRKRGHESGRGNLRGAVQDNLVHVLLRLRCAISIDVLDFNSSVVYQDADRQSEATQRHDVDRFPDGAEGDDGGQDRQWNRSRDDQRASPAPQESENHEGGEACGDQRLPDYAADRATDKNRLIGEGLDL